MTQSRAMVGLGLGFLILTPLTAVLISFGFVSDLGGMVSTEDLSGIAAGADTLVQKTAAAVMRDVSILGPTAVGQVVLGLVMGVVLASPIGVLFRGLVASLRVVSVFLLTVIGILLAQALDADRLLAVDPRVVATGVLVLASWPIPAMVVSQAIGEQSLTPYYRSAHELGVNAVTRYMRHVLPGVWRPLLAAVALASLQTASTVFTMEFLGIWVPGEAGLGGLLHQGYLAFDFGTPAVLLLPALVMSLILLACVLIREGLGE